MSEDNFFIAYRLPNTLKAHFYTSKEVSKINQAAEYIDKKGFLIQSSENNKLLNWFVHLNNQSEMNESTFFFNFPDAISKNHQKTTTKEEYTTQFNSILQSINSKVLDKVILAKIINYQTENKYDIQTIFNSLSNSYPECFIYLFSSIYTGTWIGASPETLIKLEDGNCYTEALAGTKLKSEQHQWEEKEKNEQGIVVEAIENNLKNLKINYTKSHPSPSDAGPVVHLKTSYLFKATTQQTATFIEKTHPSPAISGHPKEKSVEFITDNEKIDRRYYTGLIGPVNLSNQTHIFVNLRCMELFEENIFNLYIGSGITKDSMLEDEWQETENKATTLLYIINSIDN